MLIPKDSAALVLLPLNSSSVCRINSFSISEIETAIQKIQRKLMAQNEREVASSVLGEWVMEELRALDEVAYIRFASVYRQFQDIEAFKSEIDKLMKK